MDKKQWTSKQKAAIEHQGSNILVGAGAGAGKTAVLVARIVNLLKDKKLNIDNLLVVTFTNAAAAEMRQRVSIAMENILAENPQNNHIKKQLALLNQADITTLHSFCLNIIKKYGHILELEPGFGIISEEARALLIDNVLDNYFEELYQTEDESFLNLVDTYCPKTNDLPLRSLILKLYEFSLSQSDPVSWLKKHALTYNKASQTKDLSEWSWGESLLQDLNFQLLIAKRHLSQAIDFCIKNPLVNPYLPQLLEEEKAISNLLKQDLKWQDWGRALSEINFSRLTSIKTIKGQEKEIESAKNFVTKENRNKAKDIINKLKNEYFSMTWQENMIALEKMSVYLEKLSDITIEFAGRFKNAKLQQKVIDYSDMEHYCLDILNSQEQKTLLQLQQKYQQIIIDEYQDINQVQENILTLLAKNNNLYMTGDVKQSIYRFRLAEPSLFLGKENKYFNYEIKEKGAAKNKFDNSNGYLINLQENFRSKKTILDGINFIFKQIMKKSSGEIEYSKAVELVSGIDKKAAFKSAVEINLLDENQANYTYNLEKFEYLNRQDNAKNNSIQFNKSSFSDFEKKEDPKSAAFLEGELIAQRIINLKKQGYKYQDMAILLRTGKEWIEEIAEVLKKHNIPCYTDGSGSYFATAEIQLMLALLQIIDNPRQDIPLVAVLISPLVGLNSAELAELRLVSNADFYDALALSDNPQIENFIAKLNSWRDQARKLPMADLLELLYQESYIVNFMSIMSGGKQRAANLKVLYNLALNYDEQEYRGLFRFLNYLEKVQNSGKDLKQARTIGENEDVVNIMTIHRSKGLEFPIVFIAGLGKNFNRIDERGSLLLHNKLGFGPMFIDKDLRYKIPTLAHRALRNQIKADSLAEELRVLYVALTRAQDRLFLLGTTKNLKNSINSWAFAANNNKWPLSDGLIMQANNYLEWIGPALMRHQQSNNLWKLIDLPQTKNILDHNSKWQINLEHNWFALNAKENLNNQQLDTNLTKSDAEKKEITSEINRILNWQYKYQDLVNKPVKWTITELQKQKEFIEIDFADDPTFLLPNIVSSQDDTDTDAEQSTQELILGKPRSNQSDKNIFSAAQKGNIVHKALEHWPLPPAQTLEKLEEQLTTLVDQNFITSLESQQIDLNIIANLWHSSLGLRISNATEIWRELSFSQAISCNQIYNLDPKFEDNQTDDYVVIQGKIDLIFKENNKWIIVDYKSGYDFAGNDNIIRKKMSKQLNLYAHALGAILDTDITEKYIYFLKTNHLTKI